MQQEIYQLMERTHSCELSNEFFLSRPGRKLENVMNQIMYDANGTERKVIQLINASQTMFGQYSLASELAYIAADKMGKKVLLVDTSDDSELEKRICAQQPGVTPSTPQGALSVKTFQGRSLSIVSIPKRQNDRSPSLENVKAIVGKLEQDYDLILIDSDSPLHHSENLIFSAASNGAVLVLEAEKTRVPIALQMKQKIETTGTDIIGTVLNNRRLYIPGFIYKFLFKS